MSRWRRGTCALLCSALWLGGSLPAAQAAAPGLSPLLDAELAEHEAQVERELAAIDPEAVPLMQRAEAAREGERHDEALGLYDQVLERAPGFNHALRRKCVSKGALGARSEAIELCEEALAVRETASNRLALAFVLVLDKAASREDVDEAVALTRKAALSEPDVLMTQFQAASVAMRAGDRDLLKAQVKVVLRLAPEDPAALMLSALAARMTGELDHADVEIERAREAGLDPALYAALKREIGEAQPFWRAPLQFLTWAGAAWLATASLLVLIGVALSRATLATARRIPADEAAGASGQGLRRVYAAVLLACCVFYYLSIPLVALLVLAAGAGIILGFMALGFIPIKLAALVAILTLGTLFIVLKNMFVRSVDEDPGLKLDLAQHPRLRRFLDQVAARVDTRPVDTVYLTADTTIAVTERGGLIKQLRGGSERCLVLGVGVLDGMKIGEMSAIVAHEYGHFSNRDTAGGGFALAVRRSLVSVAMGLARNGSAGWWNPAWLFVNLFHRVYLRVSQGASRLQEVMADRWAARAYGPGLFASGLTHVIRRSIEFEAHTEATLRDVIEHKRPLANLYTHTPAQRPELDLDALVQEALVAEASAYDSHPRPADRIAWIQPIQPVGASPADVDAECWSLFADREQLERRMTEQVRMNVALNCGCEIAAEPAAG